jgi:hypothetical protein
MYYDWTQQVEPYLTVILQEHDLCFFFFSRHKISFMELFRTNARNFTTLLTLVS